VAAAGAIGLPRTRHTGLPSPPASTVSRPATWPAEDLVAVYGPRGAVWVVPTGDQAVFTLGAAPAGEASLRAAVPGAYLRRLDAAGVTVTDALGGSR
jgi:hypothetical protein